MSSRRLLLPPGGQTLVAGDPGRKKPLRWPTASITSTLFSLYRFDWPRAIFFTFFFAEPRGSVRFALGAAFLRATRFSFFRSSLSSTLVVSATCNLFHCNIFWVPNNSGCETCILAGNAPALKARPLALSHFTASIHAFPAYNRYRLNVIRLLGFCRFLSASDEPQHVHATITTFVGGSIYAF